MMDYQLDSDHRWVSDSDKYRQLTVSQADSDPLPYLDSTLPTTRVADNDSDSCLKTVKPADNDPRQCHDNDKQ